MDYRLELQSEDQFENMVNTICQTILGTGVVSFAKGKDGGKDGRFIGTAQHFPSSNAPWSGKFIIQSKHTSTPTASCSDSDFNTIVKDEIKKIQALIEKDEVDNYLLFTNRKYTGVVGDEIRNRIICETGLQNVAIIGNETINNQYLNSHKNIVRQYGLNQLHIPFDFSDDEIKKIILVFKYQLPVISDEIKAAVNKLKYDYSHIEKDLKNQKNKLSVSYYQDEILSKSLMEFQKIEAFLNNPINSELKDYYFDTAHEMNQIITLKRDDFDAFEELFVHIYQLVCDGDNSLFGSKRHVTTFLHYMYVECLIGKK